MSNPFVHLSVQPDWGRGRIISWKLDPAFDRPEPHTFEVTSSEDPAWTEIVWRKTVTDDFWVRDDSRLLQAFPDGGYAYRVTLRDGEGVLHQSPSINFDMRAPVDRHKYLLAAEVIRRELVRDRYTTNKGWVLKRKNFGKLPEQQLDPVSGVVLTDESSSFGVEYAGGYYPPLSIMFSTEERQDSLILSPDGTGVSRNKKINFRMIGFPDVTSRDVLVSREDERYMIGVCNPKFFPGTNIIILQTGEARLVPPTDPVYQIELPK